MRHEPRAGERRIAYCDTLGYAYCAECYHEGTSRPCEPMTADGTCDRCGRDLRKSVEVFDGIAEIEYTTAKIF